MNEKIQINPKLLEVIQDVFDTIEDQKKAMLFCLAIFSDTVDVLYEWNIIQNVEEEHKFRIALMEKDVDGDSLQAKYSLRFPLFVNEVGQDYYNDFLSWLVKNPKLVSHKGRFSNTNEGRLAFRELSLIKDFDINRFKASTETYYNREGQYAKALPKFLTENAKGEYEGFKPTQTFGVL